MKKSILAATVFGLVTAATAQDGSKMLSGGEYFALRSLDNVPGQGMTGTFAYKTKEGKWETALSISCDSIRNRTAFMSAMDIRLGRNDLPDLTGAEWPKLEEDILSATNKLHDLCNLNSGIPVIKVGRAEP